MKMFSSARPLHAYCPQPPCSQTSLNLRALPQKPYNGLHIFGARQYDPQRSVQLQLLPKQHGRAANSLQLCRYSTGLCPTAPSAQSSPTTARISRQLHSALLRGSPVRSAISPDTPQSANLTSAARDDGLRDEEISLLGQPEDVREVLRSMRRACCGVIPEGQELVQWGHGTYQAMDICWEVIQGPSGAFLDVMKSEDREFRCGYDGLSQSDCWEVDYSGVSRVSQLDDFEMSLIVMWVRSGQWLNPTLLPRLNIRRLSEVEAADPLLWSRPDREPSIATAQPDTQAQPGASGHSNCSSASGSFPTSGPGNHEGAGTVHGSPAPASYAGTGRNGDSSAAAEAAFVPPLVARPLPPSRGGGEEVEGGPHDSPQLISFVVSLVGCKIRTKLVVNSQTWLPASLSMSICHDIEVFSFTWPDCDSSSGLLPKSIAHTGNHGAINNYVMEGARLRPAQDAGVFQRPPDPPLPTGTSFDPSLPPEVKAWRSGSGHTVVEPLVNGRSVGYFMLDTGASGVFIESEVADELALPKHGLLQVSGVAGQSPSSYRLADSIQVGPMYMERPRFFVTGLQGMVTGLPPGAPPRCAGILGFDIMRRAILELPPPPQDRTTDYVIRMYDPQLAPEEVLSHLAGPSEADWLPLQFMSGLPVVAAQLPMQSEANTSNGRSGGSNLGSSSKGNNGRNHGSSSRRRGRGSGSSSDSSAVTDDAIGAEEEVTKMLLLVDTGAGNVDIIFSPRSNYLLEAHGASRNPTYSRIRGVMGSSTRTRIASLPWLQLGPKGLRLPSPKCMFPESGFELSVYLGGFLSADLLARGTTVFDYCRRRMAILPAKNRDE